MHGHGRLGVGFNATACSLLVEQHGNCRAHSLYLLQCPGELRVCRAISHDLGVSFCYPFNVSFCDNFLPTCRVAFPTFVCILSLLLYLCCVVSYCILSCLLQNSVGLRKAAVPNPASSPQLCPGKPPVLTMRHRSAFLPIQPLASLVRRLRWMLTVIMVLTFAHQELE